MRYSGRRPYGGRADDSRHVENQGHGAVAEDGGPGDSFDVTVVRFQRLDDDLLLAEQIIHEQSDALAAFAFGDDDQSFVQRPGARLDAEQLVETDDGQVVRRGTRTLRCVRTGG